MTEGCLCTLFRQMDPYGVGEWVLYWWYWVYDSRVRSTVALPLAFPSSWPRTRALNNSASEEATAWRPKIQARNFKWLLLAVNLNFTLAHISCGWQSVGSIRRVLNAAANCQQPTKAVLFWPRPHPRESVHGLQPAALCLLPAGNATTSNGR